MRGLTGSVAVLILSLEAGAAAEPQRELSLGDAVRIAIANDAELYVAREDARVAADGIALARSVFAPRLFGEAFWSIDDQPPTATAFPGVDRVLSGTLGIDGRLSTGLTYTVAGALQHQRRTDDPISTVYDPAITSAVKAEIVQPLLRGAFGAATRPIVVASLRKDRSENELRARIERAVADVEAGYWDLVRVRAELAARTSALTLATEQVEESKRLARLGTVSDLDVVEAEAGVSRRKQQQLGTQQDVIEAEGRLYGSMGVRIGSGEWTGAAALVPTDTPELDVKARDMTALLATARSRRAEALAARDLIKAEDAALAVADDKRRAGLDVVAAAGTVGFAGSIAATQTTQGVVLDDAYTGGIATALGNLPGRNVHLYIGLRFEVPLGDHEADVRHTIQQRVAARARLNERDTLATIENQVRTAVASADLAKQQVEAADRVVVLSEKLLEGTRKRFRAGASTSFDVLRISEEVTQARIDAARARADYRMSLVRLAAATGTLLEGRNITVKNLGAAPAR